MIKKIILSTNILAKIIFTSTPRIDKSFRYRKVWDFCHLEKPKIIFDIACSNFKTINLFGSPQVVCGIDLDLDAMTLGIAREKENSIKLIGVNTDFFNAKLHPSPVADLAVSLNTTSHFHTSLNYDFITLLNNFVKQGGSLVVDMPISYLSREVHNLIKGSYEEVDFFENWGWLTSQIDRFLLGENGKPRNWGYSWFWRFFVLFLISFDRIICKVTRKYEYVLVIARKKKIADIADYSNWITEIKQENISIYE